VTISLNVSQSGALTYTASTSGSSGNIAKSVINFGDGTIVNGNSASHTYKAVGTYFVTASVFDSAGASSVDVQQISAKPQSGGLTSSLPATIPP
jgi:PKD repeat protein